jgi:hypothetical protein
MGSSLFGWRQGKDMFFLCSGRVKPEQPRKIRFPSTAARLAQVACKGEPRRSGDDVTSLVPPSARAISEASVGKIGRRGTKTIFGT